MNSTLAEGHGLARAMARTSGLRSHAVTEIAAGANAAVQYPVPQETSRTW